VFRTDQQARQDGLSPAARLLVHQLVHQQESGPRMQALHDWMAQQIQDHAGERNSGLGQAIATRDSGRRSATCTSTGRN